MQNELSPPERCLRDLLNAGPRRSREVQDAMAARQFTPKQVRGARERQGILVERSGSGANMQSTWRLPLDLNDAETTVHECRPGDGNLKKPDIRGESAYSAHEQQRRYARIQAFTSRGIDALTANALADALVTRDRAGMPATGSCAECQCVSLNCCPTTPRPAIEIHECWYRRQCTP